MASEAAAFDIVAARAMHSRETNNVQTSSVASESAAAYDLMAADDAASDADAPELQDLPRTQTPLDYISRHVIVLLVQYIATGFVITVCGSFSAPWFMTYFCLDWDHRVVLRCTFVFAWLLRSFAGMLSDCVPLCGYRRKSWMAASWAVCGVLLLVLACSNHGHETYMNEYTTGACIAHGTYSWNTDYYAVVGGLFVLPFVMLSAALDGLFVGMARCEPKDGRGFLQALTFAAFEAGRVLGRLVAHASVKFPARNYVMWDADVGVAFLVGGVTCVVLAVVTCVYVDEDPVESPSDKFKWGQYFSEWWELLESRAMLQVLSAFTTVTVIGGTAMRITSHRNVDELSGILLTVASKGGPSRWYDSLGAATAAGGVAGVCCVVGYASFGLRWNWKVSVAATLAVYVACDCIGSFVTLFDVWRNLWFTLATDQVRHVCFMVGQFVTMLPFVEVVDAATKRSAFNFDAMAFGFLRTLAPMPGSISLGSWGRDESLHLAAYNDTPWTRTLVAGLLGVTYGCAAVAAGLVVVMLPRHRDQIHGWVHENKKQPLVAVVSILSMIAIATSAGVYQY